MMRLFFNSTMRAPLSAEPFYTYIILTRRLFVKRFFYYLPPRLNKEGVLPMEYLVMLALLLVLATGYIEATKR